MMDDLDDGYILDGFPRNLNQAKEYDNILSETGRSLGVVIYLDTPKEILEKRITGRRICSSCGSTYNVLTGVNTPKKEGICDKCGSELYQREDDNELSFKTRYETFLEKTYPLVDFYEERNVLKRVDSISPDDTMLKVEEIINDNDQK
jgi:adenylate kinase